MMRYVTSYSLYVGPLKHNILWIFDLFLQVNQIALWDTNNPDSKLIDPVLVSSLSVSSDITDIQVC